MMKIGNRLFVVVILFLIVQRISAEETPTDFGARFFDYIYANFQLLPEFHFDADIHTFFLQKNNFFREHYYITNTTDLEFVFISYKWLYSVWEFQFQNGMGKTPGNVVFDPMDIDYGIVPTFEARLPSVNILAGMDHHCFHEIDRRNQPTIYYNKPYIGVGSKNMRLYDYWENLADNKNPGFKDRFSWFARTGYFLREFFDVADPCKINGINPYVWDISGDFRYNFYQRRSWIVSIRSRSTLGYFNSTIDNSTGKGVYWRQDASIESYFRRGGRGGLFFIEYTLDDLPSYPDLTRTIRMPRLSNDRLLKAGVRFFM